MKIYPTKKSWSYRMLETVCGDWNISNNICLYFIQCVLTIYVGLCALLGAYSFLVGFAGGLGVLSGWAMVNYITDTYAPPLDLVEFGVLTTLPIIAAILPLIAGLIAGLLFPYVVGAFVIGYGGYKIFTMQATKNYLSKGKIPQVVGTFFSKERTLPKWITKTCQLCKEIDFDKGGVKK